MRTRRLHVSYTYIIACSKVAKQSPRADLRAQKQRPRADPRRQKQGLQCLIWSVVSHATARAARENFALQALSVKFTSSFEPLRGKRRVYVYVAPRRQKQGLRIAPRRQKQGPPRVQIGPDPRLEHAMTYMCSIDYHRTAAYI